MQNKNSYTWRERISYWFDNRMAEGLWPKVRLLLIVTTIFVLSVGTIAAFTQPGNPAEAFLRALMYTLGKGGALTLGSDGVSPVYFLMMLLTILYCMFLSGILFGFITNAVRSKVDELDKGQSQVIEKNHTLILGFNDTTLELVRELIQANANKRKPQVIVILGHLDSRLMVDQLHRRFGRPKAHPMTRFVCRTGDLYSFNDLKRCSIDAARVVVISGNDDFETVKAIIACSHLLRTSEAPAKPYLVTVFNGAENIVEATTAVRNAGLSEQLELISLTETLARIMVHTSRQPGLSDVFTELFNYSGHELYLVRDSVAFEWLHGRTIDEINRMLKASLAVGIVQQDGRVVIDDPRNVVLAEGDALVVIEEDDDKLLLAAEPVDVDEAVCGMEVEAEATVNALVLGARSQLDSVLMEYGNYLSEGSCVHVADRNASERLVVSAKTQAVLEARGIELRCHDALIDARGALHALLDECAPDCVLVLSDDEAATQEASDERTVRILLYLREYRKLTGKQFSITSEMHEGLNKDLVATTGREDFIVGSQISALLMAQISQERGIIDVFDTLLASEGYEVYAKPAMWYVPLDTELDIFTVSHAVAKRGDIFIGIHHTHQDTYCPAEINPPKFEKGGEKPVLYTFGKDDMLVVLSENGECK